MRHAPSARVPEPSSNCSRRHASTVQPDRCGSTPRLHRNATELPEHACAGEVLAHLQALESLLVPFGSAGSFEALSFTSIAIEDASVETNRVDGGLLAKQELEPGSLERIDVASGSLQTSKPPPFAEAPALFLRQRLPLDVIVECDPPPRP